MEKLEMTVVELEEEEILELPAREAMTLIKTGDITVVVLVNDVNILSKDGCGCRHHY